MTRSIAFARRMVWLVVGLSALAAAIVGIILPLIPTTPFVLLAAFAFMNSSKRLHDWLLRHRIFGKLIADWRKYGAISRRAKVISVASMVGIFALSVLLDASALVLVVQAIVLSCSGIFIVTRPLPPSRPGEVSDS